MSYLVLARKYRPRSFEALVGQEHVVQALSNALTQGRLHHAYLFTGTRGVGKTTVSRILAKSLNCTGPDGQGGVTAHPCGVCAACRDIDAGRFVDYMELDAASNRSVEEITPLLDQAVYKPVVGRFKVYLIDEVHMLSTHAFNAMLKTLEEPPEYLKFVLATTDPQKVPATVLSRCLQFNLRPMGVRTVQEHLARVLADEGIPAEPAALRLLARAARGSMRDALSVTDQAIAFGAGSVREAGVRDMLGAVDRRHAIRLIEALAERDGSALLAEADALRALGLSASGTLEEMADLLQQMAVEQAVAGALDTDEPDTAAAVRLAPRLAADQTQVLYSMALHGRGELSLAPDEHSGLVMVLLRMLAFCPPPARSDALPVGRASARAPVASSAGSLLREPTDEPAVAQRPVAAADPSDRAAAAPAQTPPNGPMPTPMPHAMQQVAEPVPPPWVDADWGDEGTGAMAAVSPPPATEEPFVRCGADPIRQAAVPCGLGDRWAQAVLDMTRAGRIAAMVRELALQSECVGIDETSQPQTWVLQVERETLRSAASCEKLEAALIEQIGEPLRLEVRAGPVSDSPAIRAAAQRAQRQREAEQIIESDPVVRGLLERYPGARIVPGTVGFHATP